MGLRGRTNLTDECLSKGSLGFFVTAWTKFHYIHKNPGEAGIVNLPEEYKYFSARNYINNDHSVIKVDISFAGIVLPLSRSVHFSSSDLKKY